MWRTLSNGRPCWPGLDWEVVFVDDNSPDGTASRARAIGETDRRVRCVRRIGGAGSPGPASKGC